MCGDFLKTRKAQRLDVYRCFWKKKKQKIKMLYKTEHQETQHKHNINQSPSKNDHWKNHDVSTAKGLLWFRENRVWKTTSKRSTHHTFIFNILSPLDWFWYHFRPHRISNGGHQIDQFWKTSKKNKKNEVQETALKKHDCLIDLWC